MCKCFALSHSKSWPLEPVCLCLFTYGPSELYCLSSIYLQKNGQSPAFFVYFWYFQTNVRILQQINVTIIHLVSGAGNRTHNLLNMSLLPQPLDQCSPPSFLNLATKSFFYLLSILYIKYHQPKRMFYLYIVYSSLRLVYLHAFLGVLSITFKH